MGQDTFVVKVSLLFVINICVIILRNLSTNTITNDRVSVSCANENIVKDIIPSVDSVDLILFVLLFHSITITSP